MHVFIALCFNYVLDTDKEDNYFSSNRCIPHKIWCKSHPFFLPKLNPRVIHLNTTDAETSST